MNVKPLRNALLMAGNALLMAGIALFIASCGGEAKDSPGQGRTPDALSDTLKVKQLSKTYVITGIGVSGSNSVAIINNQVFTPGMEIDPGVTLKNIHPSYATLVHGNTEHLLRPESIQNEMDKKKR